MTALIVGLGNPGPAYTRTRHNVGAAALEELLGRCKARLSPHKKTNTDLAEAPGIVIARTRSYMNDSGGPIKALAGYFKVAPSGLFVLYDDLDLDLGDVQLRPGGGDHGHNGLKSISASLGTREYNKLAIGIGRPPGRMAPADYVLKPFSKKESAELPIVFADAADLLEEALK
ncbi:aminoacyl-tRNA hydrolase [Corynebacterium liangguodongii]|uniref:Peptidyl-tRNA hydrolase n=1 Tax=Corynebacterium liangguodongii TaxID=2079535 RepID=A0A2S0WD74_9CORY|nr:aminoacyl-tRNA hydrolase [Corynebacterium liangguodongii]AWB83718.1 aminoacyl-tRNA hydrolase [Corynebacterium liangguodongii]PWB99472.1 aminoacyl-tRNA hydrolase [Corynebacterium liangguodongii]